MNEAIRIVCQKAILALGEDLKGMACFMNNWGKTAPETADEHPPEQKAA